jgi:hypothetical protein
MHGGLARWLRAAGYDATWTYGIDDAPLLAEAAREGRVVLTSDEGILRRRVARSGALRVVFVPHGLRRDEQLAWLLRELSLPLREPRCMGCGGELRPVDRESVANEAPPRTYAWLTEFRRCVRCRSLRWRGTHWARIETRLRSLAGGL